MAYGARKKEIKKERTNKQKRKKKELNKNKRFQQRTQYALQVNLFSELFSIFNHSCVLTPKMWMIDTKSLGQVFVV